MEAIQTQPTRTAAVVATPITHRLHLVTQDEAAAAYERQKQQADLARKVDAAKRERELAETVANGVMLGVLFLAAGILKFGPAVLTALEAWWAR